MSLNLEEIASSLWWWTAGEYFATGLVLVGVIGEGIADFSKWAKRVAGRKDRVSKLSTLVLILGISGELLTLVRVNHFSGMEIALLNGRTEKLRQDNLRLAQTIQMRQLNGDQEEALRKEAEAFAGLKVVFEAYVGDIESILLARQLSSILQAAHWGTNGPLGIGLDIPGGAILCSGVTISSSSDDRTLQAAGMLVNKLRAAEITSQVGIDSNRSNLDVRVCPKPRSR